ncbi:MAG: FHA domain-containing protein [Acidimicrobiales bacterium]
MTALAALLGAAAAPSYSGAVRLVQWCIIALVFLFFLRVIRAVWVEVRPAGPRRALAPPQALPGAGRREAAPRGRKGPLYLEVVEPTDRTGQQFDVDGELTVGRSPGCGIPTTYDIYSSTLHARFFHHDDDRLYVEDLGSTNGTFVNSEQIAKPTRLGKGDLVQVGATVLQVTK